jgi:hypothetical protein
MKIPTLAALGCIFTLGSLQAQTLIFSNDAPSGTHEDFSSLPSSEYIEAGYVLAVSSSGNSGNSGIATPSWLSYSVDGTNFLYNGNNNLTLTAQSGGTFGFSSVQYYNPNGYTLTLNIYGYSGSTLVGTDTFTLSASGGGTLTGDLTNVTSLVLDTPTSGSDFALDNLNLSAQSTPEPSSLSIILGVLFSVGSGKWIMGRAPSLRRVVSGC